MHHWQLSSKAEWYALPDWERNEKIALMIVDGEIESHRQWEREKKSPKKGRK